MGLVTGNLHLEAFVASEFATVNTATQKAGFQLNKQSITWIDLDILLVTVHSLKREEVFVRKRKKLPLKYISKFYSSLFICIVNLEMCF